MRYLPICFDLRGKRIAISGAHHTAVARLRLLLKTEAVIDVFGLEPLGQLWQWHAQGRIQLYPRIATHADIDRADLLYITDEHAPTRARVLALAQSTGTLTNVVDHPQDSQFITPAIVDRSPITIAIGTEGSAPMLARQVRKECERYFNTGIGIIARAAAKYQVQVRAQLRGVTKRQFWDEYFDQMRSTAPSQLNDQLAETVLQKLLEQYVQADNTSGRVVFIEWDPDDDHLPTHAKCALAQADLVIYDPLIPAHWLQDARHEARLIRHLGTHEWLDMVEQNTLAVRIGHHLQAEMAACAQAAILFEPTTLPHRDTTHGQIISNGGLA